MSFSNELESFAARLRERVFLQARVGEEEFQALALGLFALQFECNAPYRRLCEARGARPGKVMDWRGIPAVPTAAFKELDLSCLPAVERAAVFHSSGTTGQRASRHFHSGASLRVYEASLTAWFGRNCQLPIANRQTPSQSAIGYWVLAILTPPAEQAPHSSLVHMFETIRREAGAASEAFVGQVGADGAWGLEGEAAVERLQAASEAGRPIAVFGTAFLFVHLLDYLAARGLRFELPPGSWAMETGGYKGRSRSLSQAELHALISERLGIPPARIICEYGMSELSSQAYDMTAVPSPLARSTSRITHHASRTFRFPPWARVQIVSPETGGAVAEGETGLIRVFDLANVYSVMAIQTEDLGIRRGDGFALAGRAALAEPRGCSLMAV